MDWSWKWSLGPGQGPTFASGNTNVSFALQPGAATGSADLPLGSLSANSASPGLDAFSASYDLKLTLTDNQSKATGSLTWHATISGNVGPDSSSLTNNITGPLSQTLVLAGHDYKVTLEPNPANIPAPSSNSRALLDALVSVTPDSGGTGGGGGGVGKTPEPSALVLASSALCLAGVFCRRRRFAATHVA
jgi:hypothetical protein